MTLTGRSPAAWRRLSNSLLGIGLIGAPSAFLLLLLFGPLPAFTLSMFWLGFVLTYGPGLAGLGLFIAAASSNPHGKWFWMAGFVGCMGLNVILWTGLALASTPPPNAWEHYFDLTGLLAFAAAPGVVIAAIAGLGFERVRTLMAGLH